MKKVLLLVAVVAAFSFVSCKKDRVCSCISDQPGDTANEVTYIKASGASAKANCQSYKTTYTVGSTSTVVTVTCTLK
jgi:hypothetical protein